MSTFSRGVSKILTVCPEASFGVANTASGAGQQLRRVSSDLNIAVQQIESQEILPSQQIRDSRNGPRGVQGSISGQLSPATYAMLFANMMRNTWQAEAASAALTDVTAVLNGTTGNLDLTGSASDAFSSKFKLGDVVRVTGVPGAGATADNGANFRIVAITLSTMSLQPITAMPVGWASGSPGEVFAAPGKKLIVPATGQLDGSLSFEHWYPDVGLSELFTGCKVGSIALNFPASGFASFQASITGQQMTTAAVQQLPNPAAITTSTSMTAVSGKISYQGVAQAYITGLNLQLQSQLQPTNVVGNPLVPAIFPGSLMSRGSMTALTTTDTLTQDFLNENYVDLSIMVTTSPAQNADFVSFYLPRVKLTSSTKTDSQTAIVRSFNFMGLENAGQNAVADLTTVMIQDSQAP